MSVEPDITPSDRTPPPRLSVVIPTYGDTATLPRVLDCVLAQQFTDLEVIIVNDAGPSPRDVLDLSDPRVRLIDLPENGGVSAARNRGFAETRGDIVHFLDADDYIAPDLYGTVVSTMASGRYPALTVGQITVPADQTEEALPRLCAGSRGHSVETYEPMAFYTHFARMSGQFLPSAAFFDRTALIERLGAAPWNERLRNGEDTLFFLEFAARHGMARQPDPFVIYTIRPESLSRNTLASWSGRIDAMDILIARLTSEKAVTPLVRTARHLRQNAARRTARLLGNLGRSRESFTILASDLHTSFNLKSVFEYARMAIRVGISSLRISQ